MRAGTGRNPSRMPVAFVPPQCGPAALNPKPQTLNPSKSHQSSFHHLEGKFRIRVDPSRRSPAAEKEAAKLQRRETGLATRVWGLGFRVQGFWVGP